MLLTPAQNIAISAAERLLTEVLGPATPQDRGGKYPHRKLTWPDRRWADLYPQLNSAALVTNSIASEHLAALAVGGASPTRNKPNLTRIRLDPGFNRAALATVLAAVWGTAG